MLDDENQALIVDTDGDGWCDPINPLLIPTTEPPTQNDQVLKVRLAPGAGQGDADFTATTAGLAELPVLPPGRPVPPVPLCPGNQPTIAIWLLDSLPAIWSVEHDRRRRWCLGQQFDTLANNITEGWACIAVADHRQRRQHQRLAAAARLHRLQSTAPTRGSRRTPRRAREHRPPARDLRQERRTTVTPGAVQ